MANIIFPDAAPYNSAAYGETAAEAQKRSPLGKALRNKKTVSSQKGLFGTLFKSNVEKTDELPFSEESTAFLVGALRSAGDNLAKRPLPEEIKEYKGAVRNFINYVVENAYDKELVEGVPNWTKPPSRRPKDPEKATSRLIFVKIQVIDTKLEELAASILKGQSEKLALLGRIEEINGLLVDLLE
ncbi:MAG: YaaR family protein [Treponema sp.]|jgi:uncharacterized protein YaaR (DUF327 family)|nr:YaaR family protein [Treponema sp.]